MNSVAVAERLLNIGTKHVYLGREIRNLVAGLGIYSSIIYGCANSATGLIFGSRTLPCFIGRGIVSARGIKVALF